MIRTPIQICCYSNDFCVIFYFIFLLSVIQICCHLLIFVYQLFACQQACWPVQLQPSLQCLPFRLRSHAAGLQSFRDSNIFKRLRPEIMYHSTLSRITKWIVLRIRDPVIFYPWTRDPYPGSGMEKSGSGVNKKHLGSYFRELSNNFLDYDIIKFLLNSVLRIRVRGGKIWIRDKNPGSASLESCLKFCSGLHLIHSSE